jgi:hypothetical protein
MQIFWDHGEHAGILENTGTSTSRTYYLVLGVPTSRNLDRYAGAFFDRSCLTGDNTAAHLFKNQLRSTASFNILIFTLQHRFSHKNQKDNIFSTSTSCFKNLVSPLRLHIFKQEAKPKLHLYHVRFQSLSSSVVPGYFLHPVCWSCRKKKSCQDRRIDQNQGRHGGAPSID